MNHFHYLTLSALLLAAPVAAQQPIAGSAPQEKTISLEFRGGSLSELIAEIRNAADGANIIASATAKEVELPAITLREATVQASLMSVRSIVPEPYRVNVDTQRDSGRPVHSVTVMKMQNVSTAHSGPMGQDNRGVRVFSIRSLVEALPSDPPGFADKLLSAGTVLSAVENGLEVSQVVSRGKTLAQGRQPWDMRFHEDSGLLFVSGGYEQLALAHEVLQALERDVNQARQATIQAHFAKNRSATSTSKDQ